MSLRIAIVTRLLPVALGFEAGLREAGYQPVALLTVHSARQYGPGWTPGGLVDGAPAGLDVLVPARRDRLAPLLRAVEPDLAVCMGFPWKIPPDALAVPRLGWLNGHPSLLPRRRGPIPVAWAIREGDAETGVSFHRMDAELDTGPVLAQRTLTLGDCEPPDAFYARMGPVVGETLAEAMARIEAGEDGTPQEGGDYQTFFTQEDAWLDLSRPAAELHRLVWAWLFATVPGGVPGALLEVDGAVLRVLDSRLDEHEGALRVECADGPLWLLETEPVSAEEATRASAAAPSTP